MPNTIREILFSYPERLADISDTARVDVEYLLCHVLNVSTSYLYTWSEKTLIPEQLIYFEQLFETRLQGKPIAYIIGKQGFWNLDLYVNEHTLIPRSDTEVLVEEILKQYAHKFNLEILDLGTGSGAIALALAHEKPTWHVAAIDNSPQAIEIAAKNIQLYDLKNIQLLCGDWYEPIEDRKFDIIVSNPPYIDQNDPALCGKVRQYEPNRALISADNGLADIKYIICHGKAHFKKNGFMIIEHGYQQAQKVAELFMQNDYQKIKHYYDLAGHKRVTSAIYG